MTVIERFRAAVEGKDFDGFMALFAEDATFHSPAVFKPYEGRDAVAMVLGAVVQILEDFTYIDEITESDRGVLIFTARVGDRTLTGVDYLTVRDDEITDLTVFIRPLSGLNRVVGEMGKLLATIEA